MQSSIFLCNLANVCWSWFRLLFQGISFVALSFLCSRPAEHAQPILLLAPGVWTPVRLLGMDVTFLKNSSCPPLGTLQRFWVEWSSSIPSSSKSSVLYRAARQCLAGSSEFPSSELPLPLRTEWSISQSSSGLL